MTETYLPITGYLDRFSYRPGEEVQAFVSVPSGQAYDARLVRVLSGDPNPAGPGLRFEDLQRRLDRRIPGRLQPIRKGSYGRVSTGPVRDASEAVCWTILFQPTRNATRCALMSEEADGRAVTLLLTTQGLECALRDGGQTVTTTLAVPIEARRWYRAWISLSPSRGEAVLGCVDVADPLRREAVRVPCKSLPPERGTILFGARDVAEPHELFNGRLEEPSILCGWCEDWPAPLNDPPGLRIISRWDFSKGMEGASVTDLGPQRRHGTLVNLPMRAVAGARWSGREFDWKRAPEDYAAIELHDDALEDCGWDEDFRWTVPADLESGIYAIHLSCEAGQDWVPLYVLPKREGPFARIAFLVPTFSYLAYANRAIGNADEEYRRTIADWGAYPHNPEWYPIYGTSTYNLHSDGTGVAYASRRRPILTMRPGFLSFGKKEYSGLRDSSCDLLLVAWLKEKGLSFDVITDEDLDAEGLDLLKSYSVVLTGSHPEYHTLRTLDALQDYVTRGGKLVYPGGNGFYWRIGRNPDLPHVLEVRRAETGIRLWCTPPGEYHHALDGCHGGLWVRNRRPPQMLVGIGFTTQGHFHGTYYRKQPAADHPDCAWIFDGVEGEIIGDYGLCGGGAAGYEFDRADFALGTPSNAHVIASSEVKPPGFWPVPEDILHTNVPVNGGTLEDLLRADMVYFENSAKGAVFSVGSMTFLGSLWREGFEGPVSQLFENVVRRFSADPSPLSAAEQPRK